MLTRQETLMQSTPTLTQVAYDRIQQNAVVGKAVVHDNIIFHFELEKSGVVAVGRMAHEAIETRHVVTWTELASSEIDPLRLARELVIRQLLKEKERLWPGSTDPDWSCRTSFAELNAGRGSVRGYDARG